MAHVSCASVTVRYPATIVAKGDDQHVSSPVAYKAVGIDRLPMQDIIVTADSVSITEHMPPQSGSWPIKTHSYYLKDGTPVTDTTPLYASDASNTTNAINNLWSGVAKFVIGAATSAWSAIKLGEQATAATINTTNRNAQVANVSTAAGVEKARISADVTKTLAAP